MTTHTTLIASSLFAASLISGAAHAALEGRDLNGSMGSFEAYYDTVLDITWLADANNAKTSGYDADGYMNFADASSWAANLSFTDGVNVYDNWRLPTVNPVNGSYFDFSFSTNGSTDLGYNITSPNSELAYMFYVNLGNPATVFTQCNDQGNDATCLHNVGPFDNLQPYVYWIDADSQYPVTSYEMVFRTHNGYQSAETNIKVYNAWAVSPGDVAAVPEADTWAMLLAGLGLVKVAARRRLKG